MMLNPHSTDGVATGPTPHDDRGAVGPRPDQGAVLPMVMLFFVLAAVISIPLLNYAFSVLEAGQVQSDKSEGVELARGGTYVALSHEAELYDMCVGGTLPSSLEDVSVECDVLNVETLRPASEVPYHLATVLADTQVPAAIATAEDYPNPNTAADPAAWITAGDVSSVSEADKVWLPQLPVQATSSATSRDTEMAPNTWDPAYSSCRVLFPGTFNSPIDISTPTYLVSGVYHFTEPVTLLPGADVVVGGGSSVGCTTDFEAVASAVDVPDPLNVSGLGGTIVLGGNGRIQVDDTAGSDSIRFAVNRRYVSPDETSVLASEDVAIISVNGAHEPFLAGETAGDPLDVAGRQFVPASTVGTDGDPLAVTEGYDASVHTYRPDVPDAPVITSIGGYQEAFVNEASPTIDDGRVVVTWTEPAHNGSAITGYVVRDQLGNECRPPTPTAPDFTIQTACSIIGYGHNDEPEITVEAINDIGTSDPSATDSSIQFALAGSDQTPVFSRPDAPVNAAVSAMYATGMEVSWEAPVNPGEVAITGYRVTVEDALFGGVLGTCDAWFDETRCVVPLNATDGPLVDITVEAIQLEGDPAVEAFGAPASVLGFSWLPGTGTPPADPVAPTVDVDPTPILDFSMESGNAVEVTVDGYIAVPQGKVTIGADQPAFKTVQLTGGVLAADIELDAGGASPATLVVEFDNPEAQKQIRLRSTYDGGRVPVVSEAIVQINRSGSIGVNSWIVGGSGTIDGAPTGGSTDGGADGGSSDGGSSDGGTTDGGSTDGGSTDGGSTDGGSTDGGSTDGGSTDGGTSTPTPGSFNAFDYCGSGYSVWLNDFGAGQWLAEYWNFDGSVDPTVDFGSAIFAGTPDGFENRALVDQVWASDQGPAGQDALYATRHSATIELLADCELKLEVGGDDGFALYVDGVRVAEDWDNNTVNTIETTINLTAGQHTIVVDHYDAGGSAEIGLSWSVEPPAPDPTIGSFDEFDYCSSGQEDFTTAFGTGQWLAEYFDFDSSMGWNNYGEDIFAQSLTSFEYVNQIDEDWGSGSSPTSQLNYFAARYSTIIDLPADCEMIFEISGDDGYALYVDDVLIDSDWGTHSTTSREATVSLTAGQHELRVHYFEATGGADIELQWKVDAVPDYSGPTHPTLTGASGQPIGNQPELDYCASGQTNWTTNWGDGSFLAEYWNFDSSTNTGNYGEDIFVGAPDSHEYITGDLAFNWSNTGGPAGQADYFGARYTATINVPENCTMYIAPGGNNGVSLKINGTQEAAIWGIGYTDFDVQYVTLPAGQHVLELDYYEWTSYASVYLYWRLD